MKKQTDLIFIIDKSGSMAGLESDTIGGYNSFLDKQKKEKGDAKITTILFDHEVEILHNYVDIKEVQHLSRQDYQVRGTTALYDAIGITLLQYINMIKREKKKIQREVEVIIITDGYENSSHEFSRKTIKQLIEKQERYYDWEFIFLGANIDAQEVGESLGVDRQRSIDMNMEEEGMKLAFEAISQVASDRRNQRQYNADNFKEVKKHYAKKKLNK